MRQTEHTPHIIPHAHAAPENKDAHPLDKVEGQGLESRGIYRCRRGLHSPSTKEGRGKMAADTVTRRMMCRMWDETTGLGDSGHSPLTHRIIDEGLEAGGDGDEGDPRAVADGLYRLANDIEGLANALVELHPLGS